MTYGGRTGLVVESDARMSDASSTTSVAPSAAPGAAPSFTPWARWFVPILFTVLIIDQVTKVLVFRIDPASLLSSGWLAQHHNTGVAWGIGNQVPLIVTLITLLLIPLLTWVWWKQFRPCGAAENLAFGAVLGGALGNAIDRVLTQFGHLQGVRDFIVVDLNHIGINYIWPTFNVADAGISCGVVLLALLSLLKRPAPTAPGAQAVI
jgi:signal peptidase II